MKPAGAESRSTPGKAVSARTPLSTTGVVPESMEQRLVPGTQTVAPLISRPLQA